ncbi:MAG: SGNH/GDSL hydrolase family protein [Gordonia sp. (in: high G+C Gram-positive bacteria)]|uniref:SGNH/GDSL hydrolase family protein n=1 Tax=Gordonia sp. (in: high G+C Gram-positive bacteria) TaxID=84139 RepID=UPI003C77AE52
MKRAGLCAAVAGVSVAMVASLLPGGEAAAGPAISAPPTSVTVFGDSFSDVGTYAPATGDPADPGRFTVNPGNVWVQDVAAAYGLTVRPNRALTLDAEASGIASAGKGTARVIGGNGYAEGGARVALQPSQSGIGGPFTVAPVRDQITRYLSVHKRFRSRQLVIVDGGTNDLYAQFADLCLGTDNNGLGKGGTTRAVADRAVRQAATDLAAQVRRIRANGGATILLAGAADFTLTPAGRAALTPRKMRACRQPTTLISTWAKEFTRTLTAGIRGMRSVVYLDLTSNLKEIIDRPLQYGFINTTDPVCRNTEPSASSVFCTGSTLVAPFADLAYVWADDFHPTPRVHQLIAARALWALHR